MSVFSVLLSVFGRSEGIMTISNENKIMLVAGGHHCPGCGVTNHQTIEMFSINETSVKSSYCHNSL